MPTAIVIPLLVVLWAAVLTPLAMRKVREVKMDRAVDSFHESLHRLDRSGGRGDNGALQGEFDEPLLPPRRPQLVLLRPVDEAAAPADAYVDADSGACYERVPVARRNQEPSSVMIQPLRTAASEARLRRRQIVLSLLGVLLATLVAGFIPGLTMLWAVSVVAGLLLVSYIGAAVVVVRQLGEQRPRSQADSYEADADEADGWETYRSAVAR